MRIVIGSTNFSLAHAAHMQALYEMCVFLEYEVVLMVEGDGADADPFGGRPCLRTIEELRAWAPDIVLVYNIGTRDLKLIDAVHSCGAAALYVLHEPFPGWAEVKKEGSSLPKASAAYVLNAAIIRRADCILLPSERAVESYERYSLQLNSVHALFPLVFCDEYREDEDIPRVYFSFIGTFTDPHGRKRFLDFMRFASERDADIRFMIATSSDLSSYLETGWIAALIEEGRLKVQHGHFLSTEEINQCYRESVCAWAVYDRCTQSGVVANAMMQGTPVVASDVGNMAHEIDNERNGILVSCGCGNEEILEAWYCIKENFAMFSASARQTFLERHWYPSQCNRFKSIIQGQKER